MKHLNKKGYLVLIMTLVCSFDAFEAKSQVLEAQSITLDGLLSIKDENSFIKLVLENGYQEADKIEGRIRYAHNIRPSDFGGKSYYWATWFEKDGIFSDSADGNWSLIFVTTDYKRKFIHENYMNILDEAKAKCTYYMVEECWFCEKKKAIIYECPNKQLIGFSSGETSSYIFHKFSQ